MFRIILPTLLLATTSAALAETPAGEKARNLQNWDVMFSQYPPEALAAGEQGAVGFQIKLDKDGFANECEVIQSSGYKRLDAETCRMVMNRATFKGFTDADGRRRAGVTQGVVNWVLPNQPAGTRVHVANATDLQKAGGEPTKLASTEKRICKRQRTTGSLAGSERICMSAKEWDLMRERTQQEWGELQGSKGSTSGG